MADALAGGKTRLPLASRRLFLAGAVSSFLTTGCFAQSREEGLATDFGATGNGRSDDTAALQAALNAYRIVRFPEGNFRIAGQLEPRAGQTIILAPGTTIRQTRTNMPIFYLLQKDGVTFDCNGGVLHGRGDWSPDWTGNGGHDDRGIYLIDCDDFTIRQPRIRNCGHAGIVIVGGARGRITDAVIEGTHAHGRRLPYQANFQSGIYLQNAPDRGPVDGLLIERADISGTAIGIMIEGAEPRPHNPIRIADAVIHDIPGQHGFYIQCGNVAVTNPVMRNIALAGLKVQASSAADVAGVTVTGAQAINLPNSQMFEIASVAPATGKVTGIRLEGRGRNVTAGLAVLRQVEDLVANLMIENCEDSALYLAGEELHGIDVTLQATNVGQDGVLVVATRSDRIRIRPTIRNANSSGGTYGCGIRVVSASAEVEIVDPDITDANRRMRHGLSNQEPGSIVRVRGRARFTGAADAAVRAGGLIAEFPAEAELQGGNGPFLNLSNIRRRPAG